jgi:hypothetical protein
MLKLILVILLLVPKLLFAQVSDNFNRANGTLGASWTDVVSGLQISSNTVISTSSTENISVYTAFTPTNDQYTELRINSLGNGGPSVRFSNSASTGYFAAFNVSTVDLYNSSNGNIFRSII